MDHPAESLCSPLDRRLLLGAAGLAGLAALASGRAKAGLLNPPAGTVPSTGKVLNEVEPHTPASPSINGFSAASTLNSTDPNANYSY